jgi:hypothetical protein
MKLIKNKKTNLIEYAFEDDSTTFIKGDNFIIVDKNKVINVDSNNFEEFIIEGNVPNNFIQKMYYFVDGTFVESLYFTVEVTKLREKRNQLLSESDWTQMPDVNLPNKADWDTYRQALRDLPSNVVNPFAVEWPKDPNWVDPNEL